MNIIVRKSSLVPCSFDDVELGQVFYEAKEANVDNKNYYMKVYDSEVEADVAINLTNYSVIKSFSYETQVFPVKSDLLIDISKNA